MIVWNIRFELACGRTAFKPNLMREKTLWFSTSFIDDHSRQQAHKKSGYCVIILLLKWHAVAKTFATVYFVGKIT